MHGDGVAVDLGRAAIGREVPDLVAVLLVHVVEAGVGGFAGVFGGGSAAAAPEEAAEEGEGEEGGGYADGDADY